MLTLPKFYQVAQFDHLFLFLDANSAVHQMDGCSRLNSTSVPIDGTHIIQCPDPMPGQSHVLER